MPGIWFQDNRKGRSGDGIITRKCSSETEKKEISLFCFTVYLFKAFCCLRGFCIGGRLVQFKVPSSFLSFFLSFIVSF